MKRRAYPSDISDKEWNILEPLIPPEKPGGRPRTTDMREVINAIWYVLLGGVQWRMLPHECASLVYCVELFSHLAQNRRVGTDPYGLARAPEKQSGTRTQRLGAVIIDSQSVKTSQKGGSVGMMVGRK